VTNNREESIPGPALVLNVVPAENGSVVAVSGELDLAVASRLERELSRAISLDGEGTVLDLTDCDFVDSTALEVILHAGERIRHLPHATKMRVVSPNAQVRRVMELTGSDRLLARFDTRREALASLPRGSQQG
jgi:anti-anti-sigma factor